jgi:hypothetical protein
MATMVVPLMAEAESGDGSSFVSSIGQYQTFDSRPLPNPDVKPLWLPAQSEMENMLAELRYYLQDGTRGDFPSGGIYWLVYWLELTLVATLISCVVVGGATSAVYRSP